MKDRLLTFRKTVSRDRNWNANALKVVKANGRQKYELVMESPYGFSGSKEVDREEAKGIMESAGGFVKCERIT